VVSAIERPTGISFALLSRGLLNPTSFLYVVMWKEPSDIAVAGKVSLMMVSISIVTSIAST